MARHTTEITLLDGKAYRFAPMGLTVEAERFRRVLASINPDRPEDMPTDEEYAKALRPVIEQSLRAGGHRADEIAEALEAVATVGPDSNDLQIMWALRFGTLPAPKDETK